MTSRQYYRSQRDIFETPPTFATAKQVRRNKKVKIKIKKIIPQVKNVEVIKR